MHHSSPTFRRTIERGAVLAESAIVLLCLVLFLGFFSQIHAATLGKLRAQQGARAATMYYAAHECKDEAKYGAGGGKSGSGAFEDAATDAPHDSDSRKWFTGTLTVEGTATTMGRSSSSRVSSWVMCNEGRRSGTPAGVISYAWDLVSSTVEDTLGGIGDVIGGLFN